MTPNIFRSEDFISLTKLMFCFCHFLYSFSDNISYFENSWPASLLTGIMCSASTSATNSGPIFDRFEEYLAFCFWFLCHLFKPVFFIFLYADSRSNLRISWTVILAVSVTKLDLFFVSRRTFLSKFIVPVKEKQPEAYGSLFFFLCLCFLFVFFFLFVSLFLI